LFFVRTQCFFGRCSTWLHQLLVASTWISYKTIYSNIQYAGYFQLFVQAIPRYGHS
jgi:hypothetical protein